jgi:hypothetical protein
MADKYVVNNAGLVATANAIRAKTGDSARIVWNDSQGFANAISAIAGGAKVATGTITVAGSSSLNSAVYTISGFDFTPTKFFMYRTVRTENFLDLSQKAGMNLVWTVESKDPSIMTADSDIIICGSNLSLVIYQAEYVGAALSPGSVTLYAKTDNLLYMSGGTYNWIAIG